MSSSEKFTPEQIGLITLATLFGAVLITWFVVWIVNLYKVPTSSKVRTLARSSLPF